MAEVKSQCLAVDLLQYRLHTQRNHHLLTKQSLKDNELAVASYDSRLFDIFEERTPYALLLSSRETSNNPFFHGSCAYVPEDDELYITSDLLQPTDPAEMPIILISRVRLVRTGYRNQIESTAWSKLRPPPSIPMPAGAAAFTDISMKSHGVVYCSQGKLGQPSGLHKMPTGKPPQSVASDYYGATFGCLSSVVVTEKGTRDETYWFLDAGTRGLKQEFRGPAELPPSIWRCAPDVSLRMMSDDVHNPWDLAFSPDGKTLYVTDSNPVRNDAGEVKKGITAGIYAFDVITRSGAPALTGKRLFARAAKGLPKGIVCDAKGHVFVGCDDGVEIFHPDGAFMGVILIPSPVSSLDWGKEGELFVCAQQTLWMIDLRPNPPV